MEDQTGLTSILSAAFVLLLREGLPILLNWLKAKTRSQEAIDKIEAEEAAKEVQAKDEATQIIQNAAQDYFESLKQMAEDNNRKIEEISAKLQSSLIEKESLKSELNVTQRELIDLREEFNVVSEAAEITKSKLKVAEDTVRMLTIKADKLELQVAAMEKEIVRLEALLNTERQNSNDLYEQLKAETLEKSKLDGELKQTQAILEATKEKLSEAQINLETERERAKAIEHELTQVKKLLDECREKTATATDQ